MRLHEEYQTISYENLKAYWQTLAKTAEGICQKSDDALVVLTGAKDALMNPIFLEKGASMTALKPCKHPHSFWWDSRRNVNIEIAKESKEILLDNVPMMVRKLEKELPVSLPEGLDIKIISDNHDLSAWMVPVAKCFAMDDVSAKAYQNALENNADQFVHFAVFDKDTIIGTGTVFLHDTSAGFYNLAVMPEYRKQGIAKAIHHARFNHAMSLGYEYATLQATPMAKHLDSSLGFETCSEMTIVKL